MNDCQKSRVRVVYFAKTNKNIFCMLVLNNRAHYYVFKEIYK